LLEEAAEYLTRRDAVKLTITGDEPALQLLLLPDNTEPMPTYSGQAGFFIAGTLSVVPERCCRACR